MVGGESQFALVTRGFGFNVAAERAGKAPVGAAIGVHHQDHPLGVVQAHGFANLLQHELTVCLHFRQSQGLGATGNFDGIAINHADALEKLVEPQFKPVVETSKDGRVATVPFPRRVEVENLFQD